MATVIVDPTASSNGTGSNASPKNTYSGLTISSGDVVLQRADTEYEGNITIPVNATDVVLGVCNGNGTPIRDGSITARVNANGQQFGVRVREGAHRYDIFGFDVRNANGSTQNWAFYLGNTQSQVADGGRLHHCIAHDTGSDATADSGGVKWFGSDVTIEDVSVYNMPTDAFFGQGNRAVIRRTRSWAIDQDGRGFGDNIQITGNGTLGCSGARIYDNWCDHSDMESKQAINIQDTTGGSVGALVFGNVCLMPEYLSALTNGIYVEIPYAAVVANDIIGAYYGVYCRLAGNVVIGNIVRNSAYGLYQSSATTGGKFYCNTVDRASISAIYAATDTTFSARNNILLRSAIGLAKHGSATEDYNAYEGNGTDQSNLGGTASWGANNVMEALLLDASYRPTALSPCRGAGVYIPGAKHFGGVPMNAGAPDIGAHRYFAAREIAADRTVRLVGA
ncbi:MAG: hypothetical protein E6R03_08005 [Hyphomicrobiaceae bacterium]|nr:MAG: hypothetical protein E6R03_08005 [Hyphomicrobiaceae bacterium]